MNVNVHDMMKMFLNVIAMLGGMSSEGDDQEDEVPLARRRRNCAALRRSSQLESVMKYA